MAKRIFISYRRSDSQYATDRIYERLSGHFGAENVFMDIDDIPLGVNFRTYIDDQVSTSEVVLAVIGDHWLNALDESGTFRLDNPGDFVRLELEAALSRGIQLIPIFIGDVQSLPVHRLPASLQELPMLNAIRIRRGSDFQPDIDKLIRGIERVFLASGGQGYQKTIEQPTFKAKKQSQEKIGKGIGGLFRKIPIWGWGLIIILTLAAVFGLKSWLKVTELMQQAFIQPTVTEALETPTASATDTPQGPQIDPEWENWMRGVTHTAPDYLEDFKIVQPYWRVTNLTTDSKIESFISDDELHIIDDPTEEQFYTIDIPNEDNFILQIDFIPLKFARDSRLIISFRLNGSTVYEFNLSPNGHYLIQRGVFQNGNNVSWDIMNEGQFKKMNLEQIYQVQLCILNTGLAVYLDEELITYFELPESSKGENFVAFSSYKPIDVIVEKIAFWNLGGLDYLGDPKWSQAQDFYQPIRNYLADTQPTFEDNFETPQPYWADVQLFGPQYSFSTLASVVSEGAIFLNPTLEAMENQAAFASLFPQLQGENVAFQFNFSYQGMDPINSVVIYKVDAWDENQPGVNFYCDFYQDSRDIFCGFESFDSFDLAGNSLQSVDVQDYQELGHTYTLLVVFYEGRFVAFLDGFLAGYLEDLDAQGHQLVLYLIYQDNLTMSLDNFRFWNLDDIEISP